MARRRLKLITLPGHRIAHRVRCFSLLIATRQRVAAANGTTHRTATHPRTLVMATSSRLSRLLLNSLESLKCRSTASWKYNSESEDWKLKTEDRPTACRMKNNNCAKAHKDIYLCSTPTMSPLQVWPAFDSLAFRLGQKKKKQQLLAKRLSARPICQSFARLKWK